MCRKSCLVVGNVGRLARCNGERADALDFQRYGLRRIERLAVGERATIKL